MDGAERRYDAGKLVFSEGEASTEAFVLHEGRIELTKRGVDGAVRLAVLEPGEIFGEMGVIERQPRNATARALEPVRVTAIDADRFIYMLQTQPDVSLTLMHKLSHRLRVMDDRVAGLAGEGRGKHPGLLQRLFGSIRPSGRTAAPASRTATRPAAEGTEPEWAARTGKGGRRGRDERRRASRTSAPAAPDVATDPNEIDEMGSIERQRPVHPPDAGTDTPLVLVADIAGDDERRKTLQIVGMLKALDDLRVEPAGEAFDEAARMTEDAERRARARLAGRNARLLVFGIAGSATELRLLPPYAHGEMRLGGFSTIDPLWLPAPLDEARAELIRAAVLAATTPPRGPLFDSLKAMLPRSVESGRESGALDVT
ncbi:MAG: Crp/Fnr family transcriptional regulator, partial [Alphaproteobacteria bacterium]